MKSFDRLQQLRAARADLQNPYAYLGELEELEALVHESPLHRSENPYATLAMEGDDEQGVTTKVRTVTPPLPMFLSKEGFRKECTRIFLPYVPRHQPRRLTQQHRDFITRNEVRSGRARYHLVRELARFDLSSSGNLRPHFNRELSEGLSEKKLREIEARVADDEHLKK